VQSRKRQRALPSYPSQGCNAGSNPASSAASLIQLQIDLFKGLGDRWHTGELRKSVMESVDENFRPRNVDWPDKSPLFSLDIYWTLVTSLMVSF
jgi:hypothetical protein